VEGGTIHTNGKVMTGLIQGTEGSETAACFKKATAVPYVDTLQAAAIDDFGQAQVGPFPNIFHYYSKNNLTAAAAEAQAGGLHHYNAQLLSYEGGQGAMILPSLDTGGLRKAMNTTFIQSVTIEVGLNSDSTHRRTGIFLQASPGIPEYEEHKRWNHTQASCPWSKPHTGLQRAVLCEDGQYVQNWKCAAAGHGQRVQCPRDTPFMCAKKGCGDGQDYCCFESKSTCMREGGGMRTCQKTYASEQKQMLHFGPEDGDRRNYLEFTPDVDPGEFTIDGPGGWTSQMGFIPPGWSTSEHALNTLTVTMSADGVNTLLLSSHSGAESYTRTWFHKLFDGRDVPAVFAWVEGGAERGRPLLIGAVSLRATPRGSGTLQAQPWGLGKQRMQLRNGH